MVLAAGASTRMGTPKALLECKDGTPLAVHQAQRLALAGCARVAVVLGADANRIRPALSSCEVIEHPAWEQGRLSSVQAGLGGLPGFAGYVILPVDTLGVSVETLQKMMSCAETESPPAVRVRCRGRVGHLAWVSRTLAAAIREHTDPGARLDQLLAPVATVIEVDDDAILNNVNTPEDWASLKNRLTTPPESSE
jgi:nicotine blue oxidoreductase